jgi:hypothetical protein
MEAATATPEAEQAEETQAEPDQQAGGSDEEQKGDRPQLTLFAGGEVPEKSILALSSLKTLIGREIERGTKLKITVTGHVEQVAFKGEERIHSVKVNTLLAEEELGEEDWNLFASTEEAVPPAAEGPVEDPDAPEEPGDGAEEPVEGELVTGDGPGEDPEASAEGDIDWR